METLTSKLAIMAIIFGSFCADSFFISLALVATGAIIGHFAGWFKAKEGGQQ